METPAPILPVISSQSLLTDRISPTCPLLPWIP